MSMSVESNPFRELFDRVPIGLYRTAPSGEIIDVNPAFLRMIGYESKADLLREKAASVYADPATRTQWLAEMEAQNTVSGFVAQWRRQDGMLIWVEENAHALRDEHGEILLYEGSAEDISDRRALQLHLAKQKARFEQLFAAAAEAIVLCNNEGVVRRVNEEFTRLFGYEEEEAVDHSIDDLVAAGIEEIETEAAQVTSDIASGVTTYVETRRRRKDGEFVDVSILGKPVFVDGKQIGLYAIYRDIGERIAMQRELAQESARFEQLFAASPEAVVLCENDGVVLRANEEFYRMFGFSSEEVIGRHIDEVVATDLNGLHDEANAITQQIADGQASFVETKRRRKDGTLFHVSILAKPIEVGGNQVALYGIYRDITSRKEAELALIASSKKVEQLHEAANALGLADKEEDVYRITSEAAENVLGFSLGVLCLVEADKFVCRSVSIALGTEDAGRTPIDSAGFSKRVLEHGQQLVHHGEMPADLPRGIPRTTQSLLSAPIGEFGVFHAASAEPLAFSEDDGRLLAILLGHTSVAVSRLRLQAELIKQARHDALTGVFNRHYFNELIAQEVLRSSRYNHPIGLLMIDVDRFKEINDNYGHNAGDMVLKEIAAVLQRTVRKSDMIVRYGGDEFLVVLTETGEDAEEAAVRVRTAVNGSEKLREISGFNVTVSVGSIFWQPKDGTPIEEALAAADAKMYDDKSRR